MRARTSQAAPAVIEVVRMNISQFERAVQNGDQKTAKRCIDAAELAFRGLRDVASGAGCDVGTCPKPGEGSDALPPAESAGVPAAGRRDAVPPPAPGAAEVEAIVRRVIAEQRRGVTDTERASYEDQIAGLRTSLAALNAAGVSAIVPPWVLRVARREWSVGVAFRLVWALNCCCAAVLWSGVRRVFRRRKST